MNDSLREAIVRGDSVDELRKMARGYGMNTLRDFGINYMHDGVTTIEEIIRETVIDG